MRLIPSTDNIDFGPNTKKYQDYIVSNHGYKLICVDERYSKPCTTYFGEKATGNFFNDMIKENVLQKAYFVYKKPIKA